MKMKSENVSQSCPTLCDPMGCSPPGSSVHGDSPGKNTGMGCHFLLQGVFLTQGSNLSLLYCRWILYHLSYLGSPLEARKDKETDYPPLQKEWSPAHTLIFRISDFQNCKKISLCDLSHPFMVICYSGNVQRMNHQFLSQLSDSAVVKAVIDRIYMSRCVCVPIKLYLQK